MAKTKQPKTGSKKAEVKSLSTVKNSSVTKPSQTPNAKSKQIAKVTAAKVSGTPKKVVKAASPSSSDDDSDSSSGSDDEVEAPKPVVATNGKTNGKTNGTANKEVDTSDSSSEDSRSESDSDDVSSQANDDNEKPAATPALESDDSDSSGSDSGEDSDDSASQVPKLASKAVSGKSNGAAKAVSKAPESSDEEEDESSDSSASSNEERDEEGSSGSSSDEDSSDGEMEAEEPSKKRKAEDGPVATVKKTKVEAVDETGPKNLFVGNLSWNIDDEWLYREFEEFGEIAGARVVTDRATGRSKGFGYVDFNTAANCAAALKGKKGALIDGREANVDFSTPRDNTAPKERANNRAQQFGDSQNPPSDTLFLGNLSFDADENTVGEAFGAHGTVTNVRLPTDQETGNPKGFGYVSFASVEDAKSAYEAMVGAEIAGRPVRLDYATPRPERSEGGSRGGRGGRGGFNDRGRGRGAPRGGRGSFGGRGAARGGRGGSTNRGGFGDFQGKKQTFQ